MDTNTPLPKISPISFWLVPANPCQLMLATLINRLADKYGAPRFLPHVTVLATELAQDESPLQILESATKGIGPLELELLGVDHGADRFKSVFIQLNSEPIMVLNSALRDSCRHPGDYQLDAHLSLLYHQLPLNEKLSLISDLQLPQGPLYFDSVVAVMPGHGQSSFGDIEQWRFVAHVGLTAI